MLDQWATGLLVAGCSSLIVVWRRKQARDAYSMPFSLYSMCPEVQKRHWTEGILRREKLEVVVNFRQFTCLK